jgi:hypothetical protein
MLYSLVVGCIPMFWWKLLIHSSGYKKKTLTGFSEMLVTLCQTAWCLIPEDYMVLMFSVVGVHNLQFSERLFMTAYFCGRALLSSVFGLPLLLQYLDDFLHYNFKFMHYTSILRLLCGHLVCHVTVVVSPTICSLDVHDKKVFLPCVY